MIQRLILILLLLYFPFLSWGQDYKFGKVSIEELTQTQSTIDPQAAAEFLYRKIDIQIRPLYGAINEIKDFDVVYQVLVRLKVYDKDRVDDDFLSRNIVLTSYDKKHEERIRHLKAQTLTWQDGKIITKKVKGSDIIKNNTDEVHKMTRLIFPDVKNGSVLEYSYEIQSPFIGSIGPFVFQEDIPVVHSFLRFDHPKNFIFGADVRGSFFGEHKARKRSNNLIYEITFKDVPPYKDESFVLNQNNLKPSLRFELKKFITPVMGVLTFSTSWDEVVFKLGKDYYFGKPLHDSNKFLDDKVTELTKDVLTKEDKVNSLLKFVQDSITWDETNSLLASQDLDSTFNDRKGNSADLNLLLLAMLKRANFNVAPVVLSTIDRLWINPDFPSFYNLNHLIVSVDIDGKNHLLDASDKLSGIDRLPFKDLNQIGFKITIDSTEKIEISNPIISTDRQILDVVLSKDGQISGTYKEFKDQYLAMVDRTMYHDDSSDLRKSYLGKFNFDADETKITEDATKGTMDYSFSFKDVEGGDLIGNKLIFNPLFFLKTKTASFTSEERTAPIEFQTEMRQIKTIRIKVPDGFEVSSLPENKSFSITDQVGTYTYNIQNQFGYLILNIGYSINRSLTPASFYQWFKELETNRIESEGQQVVLTKI